MQKLYFISGIIIAFGLFSCSRKVVDHQPTKTTKVKEDKKPKDPLDTYVDPELFKIQFNKSEKFSDVLDMAAAQDKLVYLDVNASWCTPCKLMQRDVYTNKEVGSFFNTNFINYIVDIDKKEGPDLKLIFDIKVIPTLLWLDGKGRVVHRHEGAQYHRDLLANAQKALDSKK